MKRNINDMNFFSSFNKVLAAFEKYSIDYILNGGYAVALYGIPRATNDIDIFVKPEEKNFANLRKALNEVFNDVTINDIKLIDKEEYSVTRYGTPEGHAIDILVKLEELYDYYNIKFHEIEIEKTKIKIADIDSLIKLKENTFRNIDKDDIYYLRKLKKDAGI
ncbi:MAG: nucleotidyl transferase AbiEii/AbiGii toxin family protein [Ignavibacteriaceae bacterium]